MVKNIIGIVCILIVLSSCSPTIKEIKVEYSPIGGPANMETKSLKKIRVEPFTDKRISDALGEIIGEGKYVAITDVTKVITDAVKIELANQGYQITEEKNEDIAISGSLLALVGIIRVNIGGTVEGGAQLNVTLKDTRQGKIVWSNLVNGKSKVTFAPFSHITVTNDFEEAINLTIKDLVSNLINLKSFREALE